MIHSTFELGADHELVENERKIVQDVMNENEIEYTLELSEDMTDGGSHYYILFLIVPKEFGEKVMEILDNAGGLGYEVDFNETLVIGDNTSTIIYEDETVFEDTNGISKPKKTIVDYIIYLAIIALVIKLLSNLI